MRTMVVKRKCHFHSSSSSFPSVVFHQQCNNVVAVVDDGRTGSPLTNVVLSFLSTCAIEEEEEEEENERSS